MQCPRTSADDRARIVAILTAIPASLAAVPSIFPTISSFTWPFFRTVTIDRAEEKAGGMPTHDRTKWAILWL